MIYFLQVRWWRKPFHVNIICSRLLFFHNARLHTGYGTEFQHIDFSRTIPDFLSSKKLGKNVTESMPLFREGLRLYDTHREFAKKWVTLLYHDDEAMQRDKELARFWQHVNTYGRQLDPCVCQMPSNDFFYEGETVWPGFESTRTCRDLLDYAEFRGGENMISRRVDWCKRAAFDRIQFHRRMLESECRLDKECESINYSIYNMRVDMGLKPLLKRDQLIDFLATMIWMGECHGIHPR